MAKPPSDDIKVFRAADFFVLLIFLFTAAAGVYLFYTNLHQTLTSSLDPVGEVIIKYNTIQRRQGDRVLWDRIRNASPIYPGDVIRVAELSGAILAFANNEIELSENTLIRVQVNADGSPQIELSSGNISLDTGTEGGNISLVIGGQTIEAQTGTRLSVATVDNGMAISVSEGSALVIQESGQVIEADSGTVLALATDGTEIEEVPLVLFQPLPSERFEIDETDIEEIEISFVQMFLDSEIEVVLALEPEPEPVIVPEIVPEPVIVLPPPPPPPLAAPRLTEPAAGYNISPEIFQQMNSMITFRWQPVSGANAYIFTLLHQTAAGRRQVVRIGPQAATSWTLSDLGLLDRGAHIWQVEAVYRTANTQDRGGIERQGNTAESRFVMSIPVAEEVQPLTTGVIYGRTGSEIERLGEQDESRFLMDASTADGSDTVGVQPLTSGVMYGSN